MDVCAERVTGQFCERTVRPSATGAEATYWHDSSGVWWVWQEDPRSPSPLVPVQM